MKIADARRRPRRVQRKIDKRMGLAHYDDDAQFVLALDACGRSAAEVARGLRVVSEDIARLSRSSTSIVRMAMRP